MYIDCPASVSTYQEILASVTFSITADEPDLTERIICFMVYDGDHQSNPVCSRLVIEPINDHPPELNVTSTGEVFVEQVGPVRLLSNVSIVDADHPEVFPMQEAQVNRNHVTCVVMVI